MSKFAQNYETCGYPSRAGIELAGQYEMRLVTLVVTILMLGSACVRQVPDDVVPQKQMTALLLDMHLADGQLASQVADSARMYRDGYYEAIFNRYGIDSTVFERSIAFYSSRPELMKTMYVGIEKQMEAYNVAEQKAVEDKYAAERRIDSIKNAKRIDSLARVTRDSLDFKRRQFLLYVDGPDSLDFSRPVPVTHPLLNERMLETIGLTRFEKSSPDTAISQTKPVGTPPVPASTPRVGNRVRPTLTPIQDVK